MYAGQRIRIGDLTALVTVVYTNKDSSVTDGSTTAVVMAGNNSLTTTGIMGVAFVGPRSGSVDVDWMTHGRDSAAGGICVTSIEVRAGSTVGSGSLVFASDENTAAVSSSDPAAQIMQLTGFQTVTGLTEGTAYNAAIVYRVSGGTGNFARRQIRVKTL